MPSSPGEGALSRSVDFLLVGGGLAAACCAGKLRERGAEGSILIVGREADPPYDRPPLSKEYLRGEGSRQDAYVKPPDWYRDEDVELATRTSVMSIDAEARVAGLSNKEEVEFGKALIATGANVRLLRVEGAQLDGIHYLRTFANSDQIREEGASAGRVVLIGGSYIASEVAASLSAQGVACTMVMQEETILERSFGAEVGRYFHDLLASKGVEIVPGDELAGLDGDGDRVAAVRTAAGNRIECGCVVIGAGVAPDTRLAASAGIEVEDGILCDSRLETSVAGIYAAGDVCSYESVIHGRRLRVEHWDVARGQGEAAALNMLGADEPYGEVPYFFSDLADWASLEYVGPAREWDEVVWRGDPGNGGFSAWYLSDDRLVAALSVGRSDDLDHARRLIVDRSDLSDRKAELGDVGSALEAL